MLSVVRIKESHSHTHTHTHTHTLRKHCCFLLLQIFLQGPENGPSAPLSPLRPTPLLSPKQKAHGWEGVLLGEAGASLSGFTKPRLRAHSRTRQGSHQAASQGGREGLGLEDPRTRRPGTTEVGPTSHAPRVWFVLDALGLACATATWLLVLSEGVVLLCAWLLPARRPAYTLAHGSLFHLLAFLALASHARTMLTDPGALPAGALARPGPTPSGPCCPLCGAVQPPGAHHCSVCRRCIRRRDHHCPWVNNCVGEDNRKFFLLFTLYTALAALHVLLLLGVPALRAHALGQWNLRTTVEPQGSLIYLFLVALNGFVFAAVMFTIQIHAILTDRPGIQPPQRQSGAPGQASPWKNLQAVLGHRLSLAWISPFASPDPQAASEPPNIV